MAGNTFGTLFKLTTFGESHGEAIGGIIDGCPPNIVLNLDFVQDALSRRRPGQSNITTDRNESDEVVFYSGIFEGKTTGTPIGFVIKNKDQRSKDYSQIKDVFRPSHADFTYQKKYGIRDYRGGGRSSARETACRVVAGAIALQVLPTLKITAFVKSVGSISLTGDDFLDFNEINNNAVRCPNSATAERMVNYLNALKAEGDSCGGQIKCIIEHAPVGLGEPVFDKLNAELAKAMMGINAVKGFEIGEGFAAAAMKGSEHNDAFNSDFSTQTNHSGGIQGGISNGENIEMTIAFKPVATISKKQKTVNQKGEEITLEAKGRHDPCVVPRAVPIVEAMAALVVVDQWLRQKSNN